MTEHNKSSVEAVAIRAGCNAGDTHLTCSYPNCSCGLTPMQIKAAITTLRALGWREPDMVTREELSGVTDLMRGRESTGCMWCDAGKHSRKNVFTGARVHFEPYIPCTRKDGTP